MIAMLRHRSLTSETMCVERMTMMFSPMALSRLWKRTRSSGIEAGRGLVDDDEPRISQQRLRDAEALLHAAGKAAQRLVAMVPQVGLPQQRLHHLAPLLGILDALQRSEVRQQALGRDLGIQSKLLRQIAEHLAHVVLLAQHVDAVHARGAAVGFLQRGQSAHEGGLAGAVRAEQSEHALWNGQRDVLQRLRPVGIALGETCDLKFHCVLTSYTRFPAKWFRDTSRDRADPNPG